jgi:hypothetical protein
MVLWRPLFEGLAAGVRSPARSSVSGVGCLVCRASVLALRAILLRHGGVFSYLQLSAILEQTILPSIQAAAESDLSPVVWITSESPAISSIDFLVDPLPLPPPSNDQSLLLLEAMSSTPNRSMGPAELMLEASFTDLRHGGDGDLRRAHVLARKAEVVDAVPHEQPFPDSWIATTAPNALGLLTDLVTEVISPYPQEQRAHVWAIVARQYKLWFLGRESATVEGSGDEPVFCWRPCEAMVRISCRELGRLVEVSFCSRQHKISLEHRSWVAMILPLFSFLFSESAELQRNVHQGLIETKEKALKVDRTGDAPLSPSVVGRNADETMAMNIDPSCTKSVAASDSGETLSDHQATWDSLLVNREESMLPVKDIVFQDGKGTWSRSHRRQQ